MAGFGFPNIGQLAEAFKKAQQIQQDAQKLQEELEIMEIEGSSEDGLASIWLTGNQQPIKVRIDSCLVKKGAAATEQSVMQALEDAYNNSTTTMKSKMEELTGDLNIKLPGFNDKN